MKNNKVKIAVIAVVLVAIVASIVYFCTDIFKSKKDVFFKQLSKNIESLNSMEAELKKVENAFEINGNLEVSVEDEKLNCSVDMKNDNNQKRTYAEIKVGYQAMDLANVKILRNDEKYGLSVENLTDKYIAVENRNLKELFGKFGIDTTNIPDKIKTLDSESSEKYASQLEKMKDKYYDLLVAQFNDNQFAIEKDVTINAKEKEYKTTKYSLKISGEELKNIINKMYETLLNDNDNLQLLVDSTNEVNAQQVTVDELKEKIEEAKIKIDTEIMDEIKDETLTINLYSASNETFKLEASTSDEDIVSLTFKKDNEDILALIEYSSKEDDESGEIEITKVKKDGEDIYTATYKGIAFELSWKEENEDEVVINISAKTEDEELIKGTFNYIAKDSAQIEEMNDSNSIVINDKSENEISQLFSSIIIKAYMSMGMGNSLLSSSMNY